MKTFFAITALLVACNAIPLRQYQGQDNYQTGFQRRQYQVDEYQPQYDRRPHYLAKTYFKSQPKEATYQEPASQPNTYIESTYQQPTYSEPSYQQPTYSEPTYQQPTYSEPAAYQQPAEPVYQKAEPVYNHAETVSQQPLKTVKKYTYTPVRTTSRPVVSAVKSASSFQPVVNIQPITIKPVEVQPVTVKPVAVQTFTVKPVEVQPVSVPSFEKDFNFDVSAIDNFLDPKSLTPTPVSTLDLSSLLNLFPGGLQGGNVQLKITDGKGNERFIGFEPSEKGVRLNLPLVELIDSLPTVDPKIPEEFKPKITLPPLKESIGNGAGVELTLKDGQGGSHNVGLDADPNGIEIVLPEPLKELLTLISGDDE